MPTSFRISVRFLQPLAHGRADGGSPEWPPSPLRLVQALVAAAARRHDSELLGDATPALRWLESRRPEIVAAAGVPGDRPYLLYVPNNTADLLVPAWKQGDVVRSVKREQKPVRPTHLGGDAVHYLYPLVEDVNEFNPHYETLKAAARSITHLGWGIDMVAADADIISEADAAKLPGHRWRVVPVGGVPLRVPRAGTLDDLIRKHAAFVGRLSKDGFRPVPPLDCFDVVCYHSPTVDSLPTPSRSLAAFEIHRTIEDQENPENAGKSRYRPFHHVRRVAEVAGMMRHATAGVARNLGWAEDDVVHRIEGHEVHGGPATSNDRLQFLPLPSITPMGVSGIRRVLVVGPPGFDLAPLRRRLNGEELVDKDTRQPVAMLSSIAATDRNVAPFLGPATTWSTVTPVILPGFDDPDGLRAKLTARESNGVVSSAEQGHLLARLDARVLALIWKAFHQAGWTRDALAEAQVEYRAVGWLRGLDLARNYQLSKLNYPRYHLRIQFKRPVSGPLVIGAGRYRGLGVFVRHE